MSRDKMQALWAMLVGFGLGCAIIYVGGGQPAPLSPSVDMASLGPQMVQPSRARFMQPASAFMQPASARYMVQPAQATPERSTEGAVASERRDLLNAIIFAAAASGARAASAATPVDLKDARDFSKKGGDIIYEARDLDLDQNTRDGMTQARTSIEGTKKRVAESQKQIATLVPPLVKKAYWTEAKEQLRRQVGTLRFDLNTLADSKKAGEKATFLAAKKAFLLDIEKCDLAIRAKRMDTAVKACDIAVASLDKAVKA